MQQLNFLVLFLAALIPMVIGMFWYGNALFGNAWIQAADLSAEKIKRGNMFLTLGMSYLFCVMIAFVLQFMVIHQFSVSSILANEPGINDPNSEMGAFLNNFMQKYGQNFRTFKHGALHGFMAGFLFALPVIGMNSLLEQRGFKYIFIHAGFWILSLLLMGGVICQFS